MRLITCSGDCCDESVEATAADNVDTEDCVKGCDDGKESTGATFLSLYTVSLSLVNTA